MLVTSASSVIACQETRKSQDDQNQKPDPNPGEPGDGGDENEGGGTEEPNPDPEPEKIQLSVALPKTALNFIHIEATEKPAPSLPIRNSFEETEEKAYINISRPIVTKLLEINGGVEKTGVNPFELYVGLPVLVNEFGDMKVTVEVYNRSKTHEGQIEVTFTVDIESKFLIPNTDLGIFHENDETIFEMVEGVPEIKDEYLFNQLRIMNPLLQDPRLENKVKRKEIDVFWDKKEKTGQVEIVIEGYQGSVIITYAAYPEISKLIQDIHLSNTVIAEELATQEYVENLIIDDLYKKNAVGLENVAREDIHVNYLLDGEHAFISIDKAFGEIKVYFRCSLIPTVNDLNNELGQLEYVRGSQITTLVFDTWKKLNPEVDEAFFKGKSSMTVYEYKRAEITILYKGRRWLYKVTFSVIYVDGLIRN